PAIELACVLSDFLGRRDARRLAGRVRVAVSAVPACSARNLDLRDAQARAHARAGWDMSAPLFGLIAEFTSAEHLLEATRRARAGGYRKLEAYAPFSVEGLAEAVGLERNRIPFITLLGG